MTNLKTKLESALGNVQAFASVLIEVEALGVADVKTLAREFSGVRTTSRRAAIKAIVNRHYSLLAFVAKQRATAGRSAA